MTAPSPPAHDGTASSGAPAPPPAGQSPADARPPGTGGHRFGTFAGVFTPSVLTIFSVVMFMRCNFVIGQAGVLGALAILAIGKSITLVTTLSVSAIATNLRVRGGGAYFLISRVLGPEFGGAIGLALFMAQSLSVPFNLLGFTEALVRAHPTLVPHFQAITMIAATLLFLIAWRGADQAIRTQYLIMTLLGLSIVCVLGGAAGNFSADRLRDNLWPLDPASAFPHPRLDFWVILAIYFPAVTGILAGINMSGDLEDPGRSIPTGTLAAILTGASVYALQIVLSGGAFERTAMLDAPYRTLQQHALLGLDGLIAAGVYAATLSSALALLLSAPRILQAVARDRIIEPLADLAAGSGSSDEPRRALLVTGAITLGVLLWAGNSTSGDALNLAAGIITMFFLYTYSLINLAASLEAAGGNPSFRPRFKYFHWSLGLLGTAACLVVSFLVDWLAATGAFAVLAMLVHHVRRRNLAVRFGDARRGLVFAAVRDNLVRLQTMADDGRNWRPTILVFSANPASREALLDAAVWLEAGRGIVMMSEILQGDLAERAPEREAVRRQLEAYCNERALQVFPRVVVAPTLEAGMSSSLQLAGCGPIRPNLALFGWSGHRDRAARFGSFLHQAWLLEMNLVLVRDTGIPTDRPRRRIDLWWRGRVNGELMILLAHLMLLNWEWSGARLRVLRVIPAEADRLAAHTALRELVDHARIEAETEILVTREPVPETIMRTSADADATILGFDLPEVGQEAAWHDHIEEFMTRLPMVVLVKARPGVSYLEM